MTAERAEVTLPPPLPRLVTPPLPPIPEAVKPLPVQPPPVKPPNPEFAKMMTLGALQPEWYPEGTAVLRIDRAIIAGFSMGSIIAQRFWRQHPTRTAGLVLCATTDRFRTSPSERVFHAGLELAMVGTRQVSRSRTAVRSARAFAEALDLDSDLHDWAMREFRSTSPWAVGQAVAALGRHHSRPWLSRIDVPTAVLVTNDDKVVSPRRQLEVARRIPGATVHDIDAGHACCVMEAETFVPALVEAVATVYARHRARDL